MVLRVGLLGTGYWADTVHACGLAAHPEVEFVGVWGRSPQKASALAQRHGTTSYADLDSLLADVEAVAIAVPPDVQADLSLRAAAAGCHALLEKPIALTTEGAGKVAEAFADAHTSSLVFFTARFVPAVQRWLEKLVHEDGWRGARVTWFGSIYQPDNPYKGSRWRQDCGALWDVGPHALSLLLPVLGGVTHVEATPAHRDTVELTLSHTAGGVSSVALSLSVPLKSARVACEFYGEAGFVGLPEEKRDPISAYGVALDELLQTVRQGDSHPCDAAFGRQVVDVLAAAQRSLETPVEERAEAVGA